MTHDFRDSAYGLTDERQWHLNRMLNDYNPKLSLRRIPESDPAFRVGMQQSPPKVFGVWEENVASDQPNWVFTLAEMSLDARVLARVMENDMQRMGHDGPQARHEALQRAREASLLKQRAEEMEAKRDEMLTLGKIMDKKSTVYHTIDGVKYKIGDRLEPIRPRQI